MEFLLAPSHVFEEGRWGPSSFPNRSYPRKAPSTWRTVRASIPLLPKWWWHLAPSCTTPKMPTGSTNLGNSIYHRLELTLSTLWQMCANIRKETKLTFSGSPSQLTETHSAHPMHKMFFSKTNKIKKCCCCRDENITSAYSILVYVVLQQKQFGKVIWFELLSLHFCYPLFES